jgi:hypothetical protein
MLNNRKLMDYIRAESDCNYEDILDYLGEINNIGDDKLIANELRNLICFIATTEHMDDNQFNAMFGV